MLEGRRALVTGASSGIGEAFVRQLAPAFDELVVVARRGERLAALRDSLIDTCRILAVEADLEGTEGQARVVETIRQGPPLGVLVNNAGYSTLGPFVQSDLDKEQGMLRLHETATLSLTRAALPAMIGAGRGAVINVASIAALLPMPFVATYGATKAFLVGFSRSLAGEVGGSGVQVQCLCPGYTRTEIHSRETFRGFDPKRVPEAAWMEAPEVVRESLDALEVTPERWLIVPGAHNRSAVRGGLEALLDAMGE